MKKAARWILVIILVIAVIASGATMMLGRKLAGKIAEIKAKGDPVTMADLSREVPDYENAAVVYEQVFKVLDSPSSKKDVDTLRVFLSDPAKSNGAEAAASRLRPIIPLLERAVSRPKCQFPVNWSAGPAAVFPHLEKMNAIGRVLCATALIDARQNRIDEALQLVELDLRVGQSMTNDTILIQYLAHLALVGRGTRTLAEVASLGGISEPQARRAYDLLASIDPYEDFQNAMKGERAYGLLCFGFARNSLVMDELTNKGCQRVQVRMPKLFQYPNEIAYLDMMDLRIRRSNLTALELENKGLAGSEKDLPMYAVIPRAIGPVIDHAAVSRDRVVAETNGSRVLLGLIAYKDRYGSYPANLEELKAKLGWEVPKDPFSGRDFIYRQQGKGFIFYSFGENMKDDHAQTRPTESDEFSNRTFDGRFSNDIIWQMSH